MILRFFRLYDSSDCYSAILPILRVLRDSPIFPIIRFFRLLISHFTDSPSNTQVKQSCIMSGFLFLLGIDWVMSRNTEGRWTGIRWKFTSILEDQDFADDIALLSSRYDDIRDKTNRLADEAARVGLKINAKKSKVMRVNAKNNQRIEINGEQVEEVEEYGTQVRLAERRRYTIV